MTALLDQEGAFGRKILDIDYDTYAEGEAELGWLNSSIHVETSTPLAMDDLLLDVLDRLQAPLVNLGAEVAPHEGDRPGRGILRRGQRGVQLDASGAVVAVTGLGVAKWS